MKVLIADDDPQIKEQLARLLARLDGYALLEPSASTGKETLELIDNLNPDIVVLGMHMPQLDGLQVAARLCERETSPAVILRLAENEFSPSALSASGISYLAQSLQADGLATALGQAERPHRSQIAALTQPPTGDDDMPRTHISAKTRKGIEVIPLSEVIYFIADHKYVTMRHERGELLLDEPLKALEEEFGDRFVRIHRNALVARDRIERMQRTPLGHFQLYLRGLDEDSLVVSRRHVAGLRKLMQSLTEQRNQA